MAGEMREMQQTRLGEAIQAGCLKTVKKLMAQGEDVRFTDRKGNTYLHYICTMYRPYVINAILTAGVPINAQNIHGNTALHVTALSHECCHVTDLMASGSDPNIRNRLGKTAHQIAVTDNCAKWLDLYSKYQPGLREAVRTRDMDKIQYLLHAWSACHLVVDGKDMRYFAANLTYHDIVAVLDKHRFSIKAVYCVYEKDVQGLEYCISRGKHHCDVNYLQLLENSHPHHMLQHAVRHNSHTMVHMICDAGADVNCMVHVNEYFKGPLFFEALKFKDGFDQRIIYKILDSGADLTLKDERGRTALLYVLEKGNGSVPIEIVQKLLGMGASIADRDQAGCTARDRALFAQRKDITEEIDQHLIKYVREPDMDMLRMLAVQGYDKILTEFQYRDTWIYACGNPWPHAQKFVENLPEFERSAQSVHQAIEEGEGLSEVEYIYDTYEAEQFSGDMLLLYQDKGGRNPLLKALLHEEHEVVTWLIESHLTRLPAIAQCVDNMGRSALHYASALGEGGTSILEALQHIIPCTDCKGLTPKDMDGSGSEFIKQEKQKSYGMTLEVHCAEKYVKLLKIIRCAKRGRKHVDIELKSLQCSVSQLPKLLHRDKVPIVEDYRDLLLEAIRQGKEEIACKLAFLGVDCSVREPYGDVLWLGCVVWMNAEERARFRGMDRVADNISKYGIDNNYWGMGIQAYLKEYRNMHIYSTDCI